MDIRCESFTVPIINQIPILSWTNKIDTTNKARELENEIERNTKSMKYGE